MHACALGDHGPVRADRFSFAHANSTRHAPLGRTAYAWVHQPQGVRTATLRSLRDAGFTKLRTCVFPQPFLFNIDEPELHPFVRSHAGRFDLTGFNPSYFVQLESAVDDRHVPYVVRRRSAFANVSWSVANEYEFVDATTESDWERLAGLVVANNPARHLRSIHNFVIPYDAGREWITHASLQAPRPYVATTKVSKWRRASPVVVDECGYEGDLEHCWGDLSGRELVRRCWESPVRGGYATHGETYSHDDDQIWWAKGGRTKVDAPDCIAALHWMIRRGPGRRSRSRCEAL